MAKTRLCPFSLASRCLTTFACTLMQFGFHEINLYWIIIIADLPL